MNPRLALIRTLAGFFVVSWIVTGCKPSETPTPTSTASQTQNEPVGGQPAPGSKASIGDLDEQVAYQRAFEATLWAMPAAAIYRFRVGLLNSRAWWTT
jgi:hypothetical protein